LRVLQPRYYSISSSPLASKTDPKVHEQQPLIASVTAAVLRYRTLGRERTGVTTTFLADRIATNQSCPVFISRNPDFRLPEDGSKPIVMIGPGTGIAPFRAFVQERIITQSQGRNLLYFGCRRREQDYLYRSQLEEWAEQGHLRLRTAFSREQKHKVYVQHLMMEDADLLRELLEGGAHFYVCGDAKRMAGDVHATLLQILVQKGKCANQADAEDYIRRMELQKRYQRDIWVT